MTMPFSTKLIAALLISVSLSSNAEATVRFNRMITRNCVLQRKMPIPIYGFGANGESVKVTLGWQSLTTTTASNGKWQVTFPPMAAGGHYTLSAQGSNTVSVTNVLIGEVWVASGQSNMDDVKLNMADGWSSVANAPDDSSLRFLISIPRVTATSPSSEISTGTWTADSSSTRGNFSAVAYYFARELRQRLNVPVGIIWAARGATVIEQWMDRSYTTGLGLSYHGEGSSYTYASYYYGMIHPLMPYGIKGVAWYQGESNAGLDHNEYYKLLTAFAKCWRTDWGQGTFPILIVQLPPFGGATSDGGWSEVREAQLRASQMIPRTALAITMDVGDPAQIHPTNKAPVGQRLAIAAVEKVYKTQYSNKESRKQYSPGPTFKSWSASGNTAIITFDNIGSGLTSSGALTGFIIAGSDRIWHDASAEIRGNTIAVWSPDVSVPSAVRYGWWDAPSANLFNVEGLPASPFRTDAPY